MIHFTRKYLTLPNLFRVVLLGLGFILVPTFAGAAVDSDKQTIDIFFSNSLAGEIESCG